MQEIVVSKISVVVEHIESGIFLIFESKFSSAFLLIHSSIAIIGNLLGNHKGINIYDIYSESGKKMVNDFLKKGNFFKHADRDPNDFSKISFHESSLMILHSIILLNSYDNTLKTDIMDYFSQMMEEIILQEIQAGVNSLDYFQENIERFRKQVFS